MIRARQTLAMLSLVVAAGWTSLSQGAPPEPASARTKTVVDAPLGDPVAGAQLAKACEACHTFNPDEKRKYGPDLFNIVGRAVGSVPGYKYGAYLDAQNVAGATWDEASLRAWLVDSKAVAKAAGAKTKMPAQKLNDSQADDLIGYLAGEPVVRQPAEHSSPEPARSR